MYSAAAICRSTHLPIPQEGRIITSDDVFGHLPDIRCINGGIDAAPAPPLDGAGQCAGLPGVLSEAGGRLPLHPKTRRSRAARYFGLPDKEISSGAVVMRWPAIYNKGSKIREEAHPVAKHLDKFTQPFRDSPIPFALAEILTNGSGEMVDLVCRFLNPAAAALLGLSPEEVQGRRLSQLGPERALEQLAPMQAVAFSGSSASFPYVTAGGQTLTVTCYQVMYGTVACLLDPRSGAGAQSGALPELLPGADLELNREGLRCLACSRQLCQLTQWSRRALLDRGGRAFSALVAPADWPALLQELLDAAREKRGVDHDFRLLRRDGGAVWVNLRAEILSTRQGATVFRGVFLDIDRLRREGQDLQAALSRRETALRDAETLLDRMPVGLCLLRRACRVCLGGGRELCLSLHMSWVEQPDGSWLAYIACADISQEAAAQAEHQIRSRMYDLLLEHTSLLTLDYDPARDLAQIQRHSTSGRRTSRTVSGYLKSLLTASYLHPEDRRRLAGAVRRAITHPGTVSCTYRADYEDTGWRRYQVSWMSLFDEAGNVYRLLGKAEDVTGRRAAAEHFRQLAARHRRQARACLASARLDLTAGQTLDAKAASRHLLRTLFDRTAGACLQQMASALPEAEERARFQALFSPDALSDAFAEGVFQFSMDHWISTGKGGPSWVRIEAEMAENPDTLHLEVFFQLWDRSFRRLQSTLLDTLTRQDYELVLTADARSGACRAYGPSAGRLPENATCRSLAAWYFQQLPPSHQRTALRKALSLEAVLSQLEAVPSVELVLPAPEGAPYHLRCSPLEGMPGVLLVTCRRLPAGTPSPAP